MQDQLVAIIRHTPHLVTALGAAQKVDASDWLISAGAIRDAVWDAYHDRPPAMPRDVDFAFFDPRDLSPQREAEVEAALHAGAPELPWEAKNQAAVHIWYPRRFGTWVAPFASTAEAVATFPETATCVGLRLGAGDAIEVVAPYGLDDLLGCICRHNAARVSRAFYEERLAEKGWRERWPLMRVM